MSFPPFKPRLCRQPRCVQGAGQSGLCPEHLRASLQRHSLTQLVDLLEVMVTPAPRGAEPAEILPSPAEPLLN